MEGLSVREKEVYAYAIGAVGAVQCGFCIPGMVSVCERTSGCESGSDPIGSCSGDPHNICRCTGYKKIIEGILLSGKIFREKSYGIGKQRYYKSWR